MSFADYGNSYTNTFQPRLAYFDIYTQPGSIYPPMTVHVTMPQSLPLGAAICKVEIFYVGIYSVCVQSDYVNSMENGKMSPVSL